jgi:hypothetical protein
VELGSIAWSGVLRVQREGRCSSACLNSSTERRAREGERTPSAGACH